MGSSAEVGNLLECVDRRLSVIHEAEARFADRLAPDFSVFEILRGDEYALSTSLATLLDPIGPHGQGRLFLDSFLRLLTLPEGFDARHVKKVIQERSTTAERRIDIVLEFLGGVLGIENKPWAGDGVKQISDYADHLQFDSRGKPWALIYLAEREPSESSVEPSRLKRLEGCKNFQQVSFHSVAEWLESCGQLTKALTVRHFVEDLASYIRRNVYGELDMTEQSEILNEVCKSEERLKAAISLISSWGYIKEQLVKSLNGQLKKAFDAHEHITYVDRLENDRSLESGRAYSGFQVSSDRWPEPAILTFQFDRSGYTEFFVSIASWCTDSEVSRQIRSQIKEGLTSEFGSRSKSNKDWTWYIWAADTDELGAGFTQWDVSSRPWIAIQDCSLVKGVEALVERVDSVLAKL